MNKILWCDYRMSLGECDLASSPEHVFEVLPGHTGAQVLYSEP